jgi:hypothetical protein
VNYNNSVRDGLSGSYREKLGDIATALFDMPLLRGNGDYRE